MAPVLRIMALYIFSFFAAQVLLVIGAGVLFKQLFLRKIIAGKVAWKLRQTRKRLADTRWIIK
ncbi:MAG: hypothetical protein H7211_17580 [Aquabacterium sp.]|nr:hypothetical protein [Ferruginibacter sp.]